MTGVIKTDGGIRIYLPRLFRVRSGPNQFSIIWLVFYFTVFQVEVKGRKLESKSLKGIINREL